jgi:hypothetical protein
MSGGRRNVEADLRVQLGRDARICAKTLAIGNTTSVDACLDYLVERAYGDPERLLDAMDMLGAEDLPARALLNRAARRAADPIPGGTAEAVQRT